MATGTYDLTNTVPEKMAALGISNVELAARYARVSPTTLRRALAGTAGSNGTLKHFEESLLGLIALKEKCWPFPLDFREFGFIRNLQTRIESGLTVISNHDVKPETHDRAVLDSLSGKPEPPPEVPDE